MIKLSFDDVTLTMGAYDWKKFRGFMSAAIEHLPIEYVLEYEIMLDQIGMGFSADTRLYKEKIVDESR